VLSLRVPAVGVVALVLALVAPDASSAATGWWQPIRECANGYVALTFDDGPSSTTEAILRVLREHGLARATFFNIGAQEQLAPGLVMAEQRERQAAGDHTYSHPYLDELAPDDAFDEILGTQQIHRAITGVREALFRPPYGRTSAQIRAAAASLGMTEVLWTIDTQDYETDTTTADIVRAAAAAHDGDIVLLHDDGYAKTVAALPAILDGLARRGLCPGRVAPTARPVTAWPGTEFYAAATRW
jgi:endo-1,4-beta-xylanase